LSKLFLVKAGLILCLIGIVIAVEVFLLWPRLDLDAAGAFYNGTSFPVGLTRIGRFGRGVFYYLPTVIFVGAILLYLGRRFSVWKGRAPSLRTLGFLTVSILLGPLLLVNVGLKEHSHRPRPIQVTEFGGPWQYRPFDRFDGACIRNCSFVSGEGSASFWAVAPALEVPMPATPYAVAAAFAFGGATGLLRMSFGGHFLSDVVFAALFTLAVVFAVYLWFYRVSRGPTKVS